jgi:hypothetical protein
MPESRESSVWRTLAVAFGDGLAFGAGLTLTNNAARAATSKTSLVNPDLHLLADRISQIEERIDRGRFATATPSPAAIGTQQIVKVAESVLTAMDGRFAELDAQFEQRLTELDTRIKVELGAFDARAREHAESTEAGVDAQFNLVRRELNAVLEGQRTRLEADIRTLRSQMLQVHKEFAGTLARLVDEQIEKTIQTRLEAIQQQMRDSVREESLNMLANFRAGMEKLIEAHLQPLRDERGSSERQIVDLCARLEKQEHSFSDLVQGLRQSWMQAAERIGVPRSTYSNGGGGASAETYIIAAADSDLPGFARQRPAKRHWQIPAVSCFLLATTGLLALHYLVV